MPWIPNDEPTHEDHLDHFPLVKRVGRMILECQPPYVIGVGGAWGSGKTSFLQKLSAFLGGPAIYRGKEVAKLSPHARKEWFQGEPTGKSLPQCHLVSFNPWQHQFEDTPLVALLHEIRHGLGLPRLFADDVKKAVELSKHALLDMVFRAADSLQIPIPSAEGLRKRSREIDAERFATPLSSQRFRELFEQTIERAITRMGRLVVLIDDLDCCEGKVAYSFLLAQIVSKRKKLRLRVGSRSRAP